METLKLNCTYCGVLFSKRASKHKYDLSKGKTAFFCCPSHSYEHRRVPDLSGACDGCGLNFSRKRGSSKDAGRFCSRKCSAIKISKETAWSRRGKQNQCAECSRECGRRKRCGLCTASYNPLSHVTIGELKLEYSVAEYHAKIRGNSRSVYKKSHLPMVCSVCDYSLHVDVCHVKPVKEFDDSTLVSEVNDLSNLVAMCKRCHWEFDNGYLSVLPCKDDAE